MSNPTSSQRYAAASPLVLTTRVLEEARLFFEDRGTFGLEGTAMIKAGSDVELVVPRQNARRDAYGRVNVEVPREGQMDLARGLGDDEIYVARIHSHPGDAFHSAADDANPVISFEGAISIVVPFSAWACGAAWTRAPFTSSRVVVGSRFPPAQTGTAGSSRSGRRERRP